MKQNSLLSCWLALGCAVAPLKANTEASAEASTTLSLPQTLEKTVVETLHGVEVRDGFRWLEDEKSAEVQSWMKAQDAYAKAQLSRLPARTALVQRYKELFYLDSVTPPVKAGARYFYVKTLKNAEKGILYWKEGKLGAEKVLLDPNTWSNDKTVSLGRWVPSWDGRYVVFAQKPNAADEATLHVVEVATGAWSSIDVIDGGKYANPQWLPDNSGFYYEYLPTDPAIPVAERPGHTEIRFHLLGAPPSKDATVFPATQNPTTFLNVELSRDGKYLFAIVSRGWNENDIYVQRRGKDKDFKLLVKGHDALYQVTAWKDVFYIFTDDGAPNKRVMVADAKKFDRKSWKELVREDAQASLQDMGLVGGHLSLLYLRSAASELKVVSLTGKTMHTVALPGLGTATNLVGSPNEDEAYLAFSSFTLPRQVFETSVRTGKVEPWAKVEVPVDASNYVVEQVFYPSKDGTKISMFLVHAKDMVKNGQNPTLLYGYGGFDISLTSSFTSFIYPWLEAGGIYAVPNLRGGGEYGKAWHDAGKGAHKQNVFDDFVAAATYLIEQNYTKPQKLAIRGGSNGGLLVGAAMTQRPDLFGAVVCAVPLLDMVRYHLYGSGKTWISEYGSPDNSNEFNTLYAYSPYHRIRPGTDYPSLLMMGADHDDRVDPMHARKFVAAVQRMGGKKPAWLRIEANAGHGGSDQVAKTIEASADQVAFLMEELEVKTPPKVTEVRP